MLYSFIPADQTHQEFCSVFRLWGLLKPKNLLFEFMGLFFEMLDAVVGIQFLLKQKRQKHGSRDFENLQLPKWSQICLENPWFLRLQVLSTAKGGLHWERHHHQWCQVWLKDLRSTWLRLFATCPVGSYSNPPARATWQKTNQFSAMLQPSKVASWQYYTVTSRFATLSSAQVTFAHWSEHRLLGCPVKLQGQSRGTSR